MVAALGMSLALACTGSAAIDLSAPIKAGYDPFDVASGDFNRDGRPDLAVANFAASQEPGSVTSISVLAGKKGGGYRKARTLQSGQPDGVEVARVGPGREPDLVVSTLSGDIEVYRGGKGFKFSKPKVFHVGGAPRDVATGDFNGDGRTDVAVTRQDDEDVLVLYAKKGKKLRFGNGDIFAGVTTGAENLVTARVNGDGRPDLITANHQTGKLNVLLGKRGGDFKVHPYDVASAVAVAAGDFNGDGHDDVAVGAAEAGSRPERGADPSDPTVVIFSSSKSGVLTGRKTVSLTKLNGSFNPVLTAARLNGDKDPDLLLEMTSTGGGRARGGAYAGTVTELEGKHGISFDAKKPVPVKGSPFHAGLIRGHGRDALAVPLLTDHGRGSVRIVSGR